MIWNWPPVNGLRKQANCYAILQAPIWEFLEVLTLSRGRDYPTDSRWYHLFIILMVHCWTQTRNLIEAKCPSLYYLLNHKRIYVIHLRREKNTFSQQKWQKAVLCSAPFSTVLHQGHLFSKCKGQNPSLGCAHMQSGRTKYKWGKENNGSCGAWKTVKRWKGMKRGKTEFLVLESR